MLQSLRWKWKIQKLKISGHNGDTTIPSSHQTTTILIVSHRLAHTAQGSHHWKPSKIIVRTKRVLFTAWAPVLFKLGALGRAILPDYHRSLFELGGHPQNSYPGYIMYILILMSHSYHSYLMIVSHSYPIHMKIPQEHPIGGTEHSHRCRAAWGDAKSGPGGLGSTAERVQGRGREEGPDMSSFLRMEAPQTNQYCR